MQHVIVRLRNNIDVIGLLKGQNDRGIDLEDACVIHYEIEESGYPRIFLYKYCQVSLQFDVHFPKDFVANVFFDPIPSIVEHYERSVKRIKRNYKRSFEIADYTSEEPESVEELSEQEDMLIAMAELYSSNTTIQ